MGEQVCAERFDGKSLRRVSGADAPPDRRRNRTDRTALSESDDRRTGVRPAERVPLPDSAGGADDRHRQQPADRVAVELFCDRTPPSGRLVRRHHPHRRRTGAADETPRRRRARPVAHPAHRQPGAEQRADLDGDRAVHGAIFELDARSGAGRTARRADVVAVGKTPGRRELHRRQSRNRQSNRSERFDQDRRRIHACRNRRQKIPPTVPDRFRQADVRKRYRRARIVEQNRLQRMEVRRTGRAVLGHHPARIGAGLLRRPRIPHRFDESVRRNSAVPVRQLPPAGDQPVQLRRQAVHEGGFVQFR